jgi:N-acetylmuramoyl-L-alanine amidase
MRVNGLKRFCLLIGLFICVSTQAANQISGVRIWAGPDNTRVVLDLSEKPSYTFFTLTKPDRLVIDLKQTQNRVELGGVELNDGVIRKIRDSTPDHKSEYRLVMELNQAVSATLFPLSPAGPYGHRLVIDLPDEKGRAASSEKQSQSLKNQQQLASDRDIVIAIDAGHGGEDPGAIGGKRTYEKTATLAIAKRLARMVDAELGMKAVLTRTGDYYVNLNKRSELARQSRADILVSIHADGFDSPKPRGASVWVLSMRRANSEIGRWLESHEKQSELLGGAGELIDTKSSDQYLTHALLDMSMEHSMNTGYEVAKHIVSELGRVTRLHKAVPEHASLAVLKSPDIPSVLVEAGFITNREEAKLLNSSQHQERIARAVFNGLIKHYRAKPPLDTLYAKRFGTRHHKVARGESLSALASRYNVSINGIKKANSLKNDMLRIGQVLTIPHG